MHNSESLESQVSAETEKNAVTDSSQIEQQKQTLKPSQKRSWALILGIVLLIAGGGFGWRWWQNSFAGNAPPGDRAAAGQPMGIPVKLATVETETIEDSSVIGGFLEDPGSVELKPEIDGRINQILFKEGDRVQKGQVIIRLQSADTQARLRQAKASLDRTQARLAELKAGTRPEEIAQAKARLVQAETRLKNAQGGARPEEIAQAEAQIEVAKSDLELAQSRGQRYQQLRTDGAVSQDELEGYLGEQRSAEARLQEAQRRLDQLRKSRSSDINELAAAVELEKQNLKQLENGSRPEEIAQARSQVMEAAAQVQVAQVQKQYTNVVAPLTGILGDIPAKVGDFVSQGDPLTTLNKNETLELNLSIPFSEVERLRVGLPVQVLDAEGKPAVTGKVSFISPNISVNTQNILAKATFTNARNQILNRLNVQAKVIWEERPGILIPTEAISRMGGQTFVFVAQAPAESKAGMPNLVAQQKPVKLGAIQGNDYQVLEGLEAGDKIVIAGILNLTNGAPIMPAPEEKGQ
ncbi:efflux RND transporter periplasmic adaptor subunit [Nodularia spumigena]|jgi:RND family efflux transporter MFP subunit|uniref:Efflux RND transporter periplasmic adaptor subunit n=1 Tax=Nodularia spumigena UHCC 0060 TaxID=3110300 RepID=A0ABU5UTR9_NODSP|nr:efflux RND transporter periplasmic adaptor subunit [Nodularia spumigena]MEA5526555.1 efflux RND transporter periplasmic adaptor subunit [Nodularia spumigena UHCC 0143]MEA5556385.1 efflux RND transporter periplasmic adaptor subunit [Nodularia spumigena CH309]MEA5609636.1 efflux RND transporter periplasmic adaptor subunit [Nodularia spumigena UHCC 0060]MEA5612096.1 efflux RND transporter periplasmic adaptor subunit [Nodularia spumigena UHCC 0040]